MPASPVHHGQQPHDEAGTEEKDHKFQQGSDNRTDNAKLFQPFMKKVIDEGEYAKHQDLKQQLEQVPAGYGCFLFHVITCPWHELSQRSFMTMPVVGVTPGVFLRRERDSNPRYSCPYNGFRDRPIRPLWHLSGSTGKVRYYSKTTSRLFFLPV